MTSNTTASENAKPDVLLIEDDELIIGIVENYLAASAVVTTARSEASAYAALNSRYDLVISDLSIPTIDGSLDEDPSNGVCVLNELLDLDENATIIVFSGHVDAAWHISQLDNARKAVKLFNKSKLPEMLDAAKQVTGAVAGPLHHTAANRETA